MQPMDLLTKLSKDIIDMDAVLETIRDSYVTGYQTLHDIQVAKMNIRCIDIPLSEFKPVTQLPNEKQSKALPYRYAYQTDADLVECDQELNFKKSSNLYNTEITIKDIADNRDIFRSNLLPILDNKLLYNLGIMVSENNCTLILNLDDERNKYDYGITKAEFKNYINDGTVLHVFVVPNYHMEVIQTTRSKLTKNDGVLNSEFNNFGKVVPGSTFTFLSCDGSTNASLRFIKSSITTNKVNIPKSLYGTSSLLNMIVSTITFDDMYSIMKITKDNEWFVLDKSYELPLPTTNILPFVLKDNMFIVDENISIDIYYPNIYHVNNVNDNEVYLFNFYVDDTLDSRYVNQLKSLYLAYDDVLELYKSESLPEIVKDFKPVEVPLISEPLFKETIFFPNEKNQFIVNHLNHYIKEDPDILMKYLHMKLRNRSKFYIYAEKIDLSKRLRTNTVIDVDDIGDTIYFDEPYYVLNIRKSFVGSINTTFRVYVDNIAIDMHDYVTTNNKDYFLIYIKKRLVQPNSIIELERFIQHFTDLRTVGVVTELNISDIETCSDNVKEIYKYYPDITTKPMCIPYDKSLKFMDIYNTGIIINQTYLPNDEYKLFIKNDIMDRMIELSPDGNYLVDRDLYVVVSNKHIGETVLVNFDNSFISGDVHIDKNRQICQKSLTVSRKSRSNDLRVFKNGLYLPKHRSYIEDNPAYGSTIDIVVDTSLETNDYVAFDICPFSMKEEFVLKQIDNDKGYVDTGDSLSYPLDLKWYDIYLNGKRLNKSNLDIISTNRFFVKNVDSLKNLYIVKRNDIEGVFSAVHEKDADNILIDNLEGFLDNLKEDKDIIQDVAEDIISDAITNIYEHISFVKKYLEFIFIDPNKQQLNSAVKLEYPDLFNEYDILNLNTIPGDGDYITTIDSNIRRNYMKKGQYRYGFTPLHVGNHEDAQVGEYMCDPLTGSPAMKTQDGGIIASGMLTRLAMHKDRLNRQLLANSFTAVSIYHLDKNSNILSEVIIPAANMLDEPIDLDATIKRIMVSFDMDVLERGTDNVMRTSFYDPTIIMVYTMTDGGEQIKLEQPLSAFNERVMEVMSDNMNIISLSIKDDPNMPDTITFILYSILLAF